jgi:nitroreductase
LQDKQSSHPGSQPERQPAVSQEAGAAFVSQTLDLLKKRRSVPPLFLRDPGPDAAQLTEILTSASRVPDHGKLAPWRFIVIEGEARAALGERAAACVKADNPAVDERRLEDEKRRFSSPVIVAVVSRARPHAKIPEWEQVLSAGAVCMNVIIAAHAQGFAANWLTGWCAYDPRIAETLQVSEGERIAGFIHIGTAAESISDRPRPPLDDVVTYWTPT